MALDLLHSGRIHEILTLEIHISQDPHTEVQIVLAIHNVRVYAYSPVIIYVVSHVLLHVLSDAEMGVLRLVVIHVLVVLHYAYHLVRPSVKILLDMHA